MPETDIPGVNIGRLGAEDVVAANWATTGWVSRGSLAIVGTQTTTANQPTVSTRNGKPAIALTSSQFVNLSTDNLPTGDMTMFVAAYMNNIGTGQWRRVMSMGNGSTDDNTCCQIVRKGSNNYIGEFTIGTGTTDWGGVDALVCVTKKGTVGKVWVNDVLVATGAFASVLSKAKAYIGRGQQYADNWPGLVQQGMYGDQCLSDAMVRKTFAWASYYTGQNGANVAADNPDKAAAPTVSDGSGGTTPPATVRRRMVRVLN
jgi:hypothetical protein